MANRANPAAGLKTRLRILLAMLCLIAFASGPMACLAAVPQPSVMQTTDMQAASIEMDCSPCCSHRTPESVSLGCCTTPQDIPPALILTATDTHPALAITPFEGVSATQHIVFASFVRPSAVSPPPPRLVALRI